MASSLPAARRNDVAGDKETTGGLWLRNAGQTQRPMIYGKDVAGMALIVNDKPEHACSLSFCASRSLGVFRIWRRNCLGSRYSSANFEYASTDATTGPDAYAWTAAHSHSAMRPRTNAATRTGSV